MREILNKSVSGDSQLYLFMILFMMELETKQIKASKRGSFGLAGLSQVHRIGGQVLKENFKFQKKKGVKKKNPVIFHYHFFSNVFSIKITSVD